MTAVWNLRTRDENYPGLDHDIEVDVAIIGGGITGITTALRLQEQGLQTTILEARRVGGGSTGNSTGNLYATVSLGLASLQNKWDDLTIKTVVASRYSALQRIEQRVLDQGIECDFARRPLYFCITDEEQREQLDAECSATRLTGLTADIVNEVPGLPAPVKSALRIENQAQFNPLRYVQDLARTVARMGGFIHEYTPALAIDAKACTVSTAHATVRARHIVHATHTPKGIHIVQAEMAPHREYGIAGIWTGDPSLQGIHWVLDGFHSIRTWQNDGKTWLVVIGEKHPVGEVTSNHYRGLEDYARNRLGVNDEWSVTHQWSAQQYRPADLLPYIGRSGEDHVYTGTGYAADGLIWGEVAADLFCDQIMQRDNPYAGLYNPRRFTPVQSARQWASLSAKTGKHLTFEYLHASKIRNVKRILPGSGRIMSVKRKKLALYRDDHNHLHAFSAACSHMKCAMHWNEVDHSWDCPCHGSRFEPQGAIIEGPALTPLERVDLSQ